MKYNPHLYIFIFTILFTSCKFSFEQVPVEILSPAQVKEDFAAFTSHIEKEVPHPYYSCPKNKYDSVKNIVASALADSMTVVQEYRAFYPLVQILNDAHFSIHLPDSFTAVDSNLYFPLKVILKDNQLFVLKNLSSSPEIKKGEEIVSINGVLVKSIVEKIRACNIKSSNEENFFERWTEEAFAYRLNTLTGLHSPWLIETKDRKRFTIIGITDSKLSAEDNNKDSLYTFKILENKPDKIAYIKIASLIFEEQDQRNKLDSFLRKSFKQIKENSIQSLIIDIRDDLGGSSLLAKDILDYTTTKSYTLGWGEEYFKNGKLVTDFDSSLHAPAAMEYKFSGKTVLLSDALTYSSAHMMQVEFKYYGLGQTVGQISSEPLFITGEVKKLILPNSRCRFYYPVSNFILPGFDKNKKKYFVPNYEINPTVDDRLAGKDSALTFAMNLCMKSK